MHHVIFGDGPMGRAVADELAATRGAARLLGRPRSEKHATSDLAGAEIVHDFSTAPAVAANVEVALDAGVRRFVIGTTGWGEDRDRIEAMIAGHGAAAVVAASFSPGATVMLMIAERVAAALGPLGGYDPFIVEWHRAGKRDRPSGTALALAARLALADGCEPPISSIRAGASPGMHLVGWDAPGETLELRLTARDRRCYAAGARMAADWLSDALRSPGFHSFASVIDDLTTERIPT